MGWWRETIDIVKKMIQRPANSLWGFADLSRCQRPWRPTVFRIFWIMASTLTRSTVSFGAFCTQIEISSRCSDWIQVSFIDHGSGLVIGETALLKGVLLYHEWLSVGLYDIGKRHPFVRKGALISFMPAIGPVEIGENATTCAERSLWQTQVVFTVVGIPAKIVREFMDRRIISMIHEVEENESTANKLRAG